MSIEQKIAELLAESKAAELVEAKKKEMCEADIAEAKKKEMCEEDDLSEEQVDEEAVKPAPETPNPDSARNNVDNEKEAEGGTAKKTNRATQGASAPEATHLSGVKEDVDALLNGENLSEEFKQKATTIFEAAVTTRVKAELSRIEEEYNSKLEEAATEIKEGLVEQVDGYLGYIAEQWIAQNEIALERGIKSEILEGFIGGMKDLFVEHYIDIPEEKYDLLGSLEEQVETLESKLNEQVATNIELAKTLAEQKRVDIVKEASGGLTDTEIEKFTGLVEELSYEDSDTFKTKVTTIRENYFNTKAQADVKSVVTDTPVEQLVEGKKLDPTMNAYLSMLNRK